MPLQPAGREDPTCVHMKGKALGCWGSAAVLSKRGHLRARLPVARLLGLFHHHSQGGAQSLWEEYENHPYNERTGLTGLGEQTLPSWLVSTLLLLLQTELSDSKSPQSGPSSLSPRRGHVQGLAKDVVVH